MKVLLVNHGSAGDWGGGDSVQIRETAKRLEQRGHKVMHVNDDKPAVAGFDLVHLFNCRVHESFNQQMKMCRQSGVPVVVSPIWVSIGRALWGSRASVGILKQAVETGADAVEPLMQKLKARCLTVELGGGECVESNGYPVQSNAQMEMIGNLLNNCDAILPNSWLELKALQTDLNWCGNTFDVAPYGVDPRLFLDADPSLFRQKTGINGDFILQAGRIEPCKNQAMLCWALRKTDLQIVLIGGRQHWPSYAELCKEISGDRLTVIEHLPQPLLASAYAAAGVHVLPSWMETCGLVTLEAALSGTPVVASTFGHELEYLKGDAWYCDPADPLTIRKAVLAALGEGSHGIKAMRLKGRILSEFNWERTVDITESLYKRIINGSASHHQAVL